MGEVRTPDYVALEKQHLARKTAPFKCYHTPPSVAEGGRGVGAYLPQPSLTTQPIPEAYKVLNYMHSKYQGLGDS